MNARQERYKANRIAGMLPENAAIAAGYSKTYARKKAYRIERVAEIGIRDALEQAGLTTKYQAKKIFKLTNAKKPKGITGEETDDCPAQLRALEHAANLKKQTHSKDDKKVQLTQVFAGLSQISPEQLADIINRRFIDQQDAKGK